MLNVMTMYVKRFTTFLFWSREKLLPIRLWPDLSHAIRFFPRRPNLSHAVRFFPTQAGSFPRYHIFSHAVRFFPTLVTIFPTLSDCSQMVIYRSLAFHTQMFCGWREKTHGKCCKTPINSLMKVNNRMVSSFVTVFRHFFRIFL